MGGGVGVSGRLDATAKKTRVNRMDGPGTEDLTRNDTALASRGPFILKSDALRAEISRPRGRSGASEASLHPNPLASVEPPFQGWHLRQRGVRVLRMPRIARIALWIILTR